MSEQIKQIEGAIVTCQIADRPATRTVARGTEGAVCVRRWQKT